MTRDEHSDLHRYFDHAALKPEVTEQQIIRLCAEARRFGFFAVAVNPVWVTTAHKECTGSSVQVLSVSGFPLGAARTDVKVIEAVKAVSDGASEIDMVANIGWLVDGQTKKAEEEIAEVRSNLPFNVILKVIIEAGKLQEQQQLEATKAVLGGGAQFVKTCTGFFGGATVEQVRTLRRAAGQNLGVKASGGIRTLQQCQDLIDAGADRLGSSASADIMKELAAKCPGA
ncbi:MAG: deoxyribose-phosphate aldolase [Candidatus Zixiibacteriota bacterium]